MIGMSAWKDYLAFLPACNKRMWGCAGQVLSLWLQRNMLSETVLKPELGRLKLRREELAIAAAAKAAAEATIGCATLHLFHCWQPATAQCYGTDHC